MEKTTEKIPKIIHYCWLGGKEKPQDVQQYMNGWKEKLKDYEIKEWNETTFPFKDIHCRYLTEAMENKKWAFVTDYMRLYILYQYGGIYLDTDVELLRSLDDFLDCESFIGLESSYTLCTAVIGAKPGQAWLKELLDEYDKRIFISGKGKMDTMPNSQYIFNYLSEKERLAYTKEVQKLSNGMIIYPQEYFSPMNYLTMQTNVTEKTYGIHHYKGTWKSDRERKKDQIQGAITRIIGEKNRKRLKKLLKG